MANVSQFQNALNVLAGTVGAFQSGDYAAARKRQEGLQAAQDLKNLQTAYAMQDFADNRAAAQYLAPLAQNMAIAGQNNIDPVSALQSNWNLMQQDPNFLTMTPERQQRVIALFRQQVQPYIADLLKNHQDKQVNQLTRMFGAPDAISQANMAAQAGNGVGYIMALQNGNDYINPDVNKRGVITGANGLSLNDIIAGAGMHPESGNINGASQAGYQYNFGNNVQGTNFQYSKEDHADRRKMMNQTMGITAETEADSHALNNLRMQYYMAQQDALAKAAQSQAATAAMYGVNTGVPGVTTSTSVSTAPYGHPQNKSVTVTYPAPAQTQPANAPTATLDLSVPGNGYRQTITNSTISPTVIDRIVNPKGTYTYGPAPINPQYKTTQQLWQQLQNRYQVGR